MPLSELCSSGAWAILPSALEPFLQTLLRAVTPGADQAPPSSTSGDGRPAGYSLREGIAVIDVHGVIQRRGGSIKIFGMSFSWNGQDSVRAAIDAAMSDTEARAILLSFDSPGGVAPGVKELADFISARNAKPIYAYVDGQCASAAYWLAASTGRVFAPVTAMVGGIGVISAHVDRSGMNAAMGIRITYMTSGTWKATGNPDSPLSASDQAYFQQTLSKLHEVFRDDVAAKMPVNTADPKVWGDGQMFLAEKALEVGLLSGIVTDQDALIAEINKEMHMDKAEFARKHPELLALIQAEALAEAESSLKTGHEAHIAAIAANTAALVTAVAGKEAAEQVNKLAASGVTAAQLEAMAPMLAAPASSDTDEKGSRADILTALRSATPFPVNTKTVPWNDDPVMDAVNRISSIRV